MKRLNKEELFTGIRQGISLLNSRLISLKIEYIENSLMASLELRVGFEPNEKSLFLVFTEVEEYSFVYSRSYSFYNVESYKFFLSKEDVFLSLDPVDELSERSLNDQDYILAKSVYGLVEDD